jgi:Sel1 repeat-containing protein
MRHQKTAAAALAGVVICGAAVFWLTRRETPKQTELLQAQYRARAEHGDTEAQYYLGAAYYYGSGVPQDYPEAIRWFRKSAERGNAEAQYALGYAYLYGQGVAPDLAEAIRWTQGAAGQGYPRAQCQLASLYYLGKGVPRDVVGSLSWYRKCAAQGDANGQRWLGYLYEQGEGMPRDSVEAARWYSKAAEQGDLAAQFYLARAYRTGRGAPQTYVKAAHWYLKIAEFIAVHCVRRMGWTPFVALLLLVCAIVVPERRWGRAKWLSWALISLGSATYVLHLVSGTACRGAWRPFGIVALVILSALSAYAAVYERRRAVAPARSTIISEAATGSRS